MSANALLIEFESEATATRRMLERVPDDKLAWRPHPKSMSLGYLALHIAASPAGICRWVTGDQAEMNGSPPVRPKTTAEILKAHDEAVAEVRAILRQLTDQDLAKRWTGTMNGRRVITMPKAGLVRAFVMNHTYHHRGQLSVYLRLLDIPIPVIYANTADENPMAGRA